MSSRVLHLSLNGGTVLASVRRVGTLTSRSEDAHSTAEVPADVVLFARSPSMPPSPFRAPTDDVRQVKSLLTARSRVNLDVKPSSWLCWAGPFRLEMVEGADLVR